MKEKLRIRDSRASFPLEFGSSFSNASKKLGSFASFDSITSSSSENIKPLFAGQGKKTDSTKISLSKLDPIASDAVANGNYFFSMYISYDNVVIKAVSPMGEVHL